MSRVIIVANRLPVTVRVNEGTVEVQKSSGGLATGLLRPHEQSGGLWIGWSGAPGHLSDEQRAQLDEQLTGMRLVGVPLTDEQAEDVSKLIERLEQDEDVQKVFHNMS